MGDVSPGQSIGEHWTLLGVVAGFLLGIFLVGARAKKAFRDEVHEGLVLSLSNSGGDLIRVIVHGAVSDAMEKHASVCPHRDRISELERRLHTLEGMP